MTKSDRELLELAAKAYGLNGEYYKKQRMVREFVFVTEEGVIASGRTALSLWNPLTDDGDALRLAVVLGLDVTIDNGRSHTWADTHSMPGEALVKELHGNDALAATRRAIVRAAAAIGETLP